MASLMSEQYHQPPPPPPVASKQKAALLLNMANAVEESSARQRRKLQRVNNAEAVDEMLWDLEREATGHESRMHLHDTTMPQKSSRPIIQPQQVQLLYSAMILYRENAELRYQLLELRHLDLSRSFVELESRYRRLEAEQEGWKQSCQALQQAAAEDGTSPTNHHHNHNHTTSQQQSPQRHVPSFQNSTVPILQQELKLLSAQRNQLLQANLELRKQLKQMQIQMQTPKAGEDAMTATCHRCHPELLAGRQHFATEILASLVEHFDSSLTSDTNHSIRSISNLEDKKQQEPHNMQSPDGVGDDDESKDDHEDEDGDASTMSDEDDHISEDPEAMMDNTVRREENKHEDKMNLLGMQFRGTGARPVLARNGVVAETGSSRPQAQRPAEYSPIKQKSIVWSPSSQERQQGFSSTTSPIAQKPKLKVHQRPPTLNSIMPMGQQQSQPPTQENKVQDIQVANARDTTVNTQGIRPDPLLGNREITIQQPDGTKAQTAAHAVPTTNGHGNNHYAASTTAVVTPNKRMDRFGLLDEFGRTTDNSNLGGSIIVDTSTSGDTIPTANTSGASDTNNGGIGLARFRRKSAPVVPSQHQPASRQMQAHVVDPTQTTPPRQRRASQRSPPSPATPAASPAAGPGASLPATTNARHLEYHLPGLPAAASAAAAPPSTRHSLMGAMNARNLEFSPHGNPSPSPMRGGRVNKTATSPGPKRRVTQPVLKRPTPPHDAMGPASSTSATRNHPAAGMRNQGYSPAAAGAPTTMYRTTNASNTSMRGGNGSRPVAGHPRGVPLMPNNHPHQVVANNTRAGVPSHPQQATGNQSARNKNEERKEERKPSYFERIKKTLQQEI